MATISKKVQQAGAVSLPRGFQQPGLHVEITVQDNDTLLLKFESVAVPGVNPKEMKVYLFCVKLGDASVTPRIRAQFRAIDATGHVVGAWDASALSYGMHNFLDSHKDMEITAKCANIFPGWTIKFVEAITTAFPPGLPDVVWEKYQSIKRKEEAR